MCADTLSKRTCITPAITPLYQQKKSKLWRDHVHNSSIEKVNYVFMYKATKKYQSAEYKDICPSD